MTDEATRMPQESFTDKIGQTVRVGDVIAYTHAEGRSATLRIGKVLGINEVHTEAPSSGSRLGDPDSRGPVSRSTRARASTVGREPSGTPTGSSSSRLSLTPSPSSWRACDPRVDPLFDLPTVANLEAECAEDAWTLEDYRQLWRKPSAARRSSVRSVGSRWATWSTSRRRSAATSRGWGLSPGSEAKAWAGS